LRGIRLLNLTTCHGDLDLCVVPAGNEGYEDLVRAAVARTPAVVACQPNFPQARDETAETGSRPSASTNMAAA